MATTRQKRAAKKISENIGSENPKPVGEILREVGYSESISESPALVTESKGFKELMAEFLPDSFLVDAHKQLFSQKQVAYFTFSKAMSDAEIIEHVRAAGIEVITVREGEKGKMAFYSIPDAAAIKNGLDMAYKIGGKYPKEGSGVAVQVNIGDRILEDKGKYK